MDVHVKQEDYDLDALGGRDSGVTSFDHARRRHKFKNAVSPSSLPSATEILHSFAEA